MNLKNRLLKREATSCRCSLDSEYNQIDLNTGSYHGVSGKKHTNIMKTNLLTLTSKAIFMIVLMIINIAPIKAQDSIRVKGKIVTGNNKPVSDVSVSIEGSFELPVITNGDGEFELTSVAPNSWLIIAPTNSFKTKRVYLNNRESIKIFLSEKELPSGEDQLNILAQKRLKRNIISSFSELNVNEIYHTPSMSVDQQMQGRVPGMFVTNRSGDPGSGAVTLIRGVNSINANNQPLYVIDGIMLNSQSLFNSNLDGYTFNPLLWVNPLDISSAVVVKDPAITANYGSKASNGLIFIETLDPSATETSIEVDIRSGYSLQPDNKFPQLDAGQHKTLINEVLFTSGLRGEVMKEEYPNLFLTPDEDRYIDYQHNTKWQDLIFQDASMYNFNVKVKGGDQIARYGLSLGYIQADGIIKSTNYDAFNLRFISFLNIFTWLKMNAGVSLVFNSAMLKESAKVKETSPILTSLGKSPMLNPYQYDVEKRRMTTLAEVDELGVSNPMAVINNFEAGVNNYNFIYNFGFDIALKKNLALNTNFGLNYNVLKEKMFLPNKGMEHYYNNEARNVSKASNNDFNSLSSITYLRWDAKLNSDHKLASTTGLNIISNKYQYDWALGKNSHENDEYRMIQDGLPELREFGGMNRNWNWLSVYENLVYSYRDRYLLTASVSLDGSSRVGNDAANTIKLGSVPFGLFYSGGAAWRLSGESFLKNVSWLEEMKLRVSYGKTGNDDIGESSASQYYQSAKFRESVGLYPAVIANPELSYERLSQLNTGLDLSLFGDRFKVTFDYFKSTTEDMLIYTPLESYLGYKFRPENGGTMKNNGWELSTYFRIINGKSFIWDIQANLSTSKNEITQINGKKIVTDMKGAQIVNMEGESANSFYGYIFEGVISSELDATQLNLLNNRNIPFRAGDAKFKDISGPSGSPDGIINDYDKTVIGSAIPEYYGGLSNAFTYKRWTLSSFIQFTYGNEIFNYVRYINEGMTGLQNQSATVLNRWQYNGQITDIPRALWKDPVGNTAFSSRWMEDGSYLRIKNITLSYKIPNEFLLFKNGEFYVSANNIFTFSKYLGYDPEFAYSQSQNDLGIDYGMTPQAKQFIVGIKFGL
jgi:TonB-linked SusC/RagA family outer membrane protein